MIASFGESHPKIMVEHSYLYFFIFYFGGVNKFNNLCFIWFSTVREEYFAGWMRTVKLQKNIETFYEIKLKNCSKIAERTVLLVLSELKGK